MDFEKGSGAAGSRTGGDTNVLIIVKVGRGDFRSFSFDEEGVAGLAREASTIVARWEIVAPGRGTAVELFDVSS